MRTLPSRLPSASIALVLCLHAIGCGGGADDRLARAHEGVVIVGIEEAPESLDPRIGTSVAAFRFMQLVYNPLTSQDKNGRIAPDLAESWEVEAVEEAGEPQWRWVFRLREGVRFHDGRRLTADDAVYTFRSLRFGGITSGKKAAFDAVVSVEAPDPRTVVFTLGRPQPWFAENLAAVGIVPRGFPADGSEPPIGTGPFRFLGRAGPNRIDLEANEDCFRGAPGIRRLSLKVIPNDTTRALELMRGSIDVVINDMTDSSVAFLSRRSGLKSITSPGLGYSYLGINHRHSILGNRRVRQAIAYAIDRESIIDNYLAGLARPASSALIPELWETGVHFRDYGYDPELACRLLDEAGYPDPDGDGPRRRFTLEFKVAGYSRSRDLAVIMKQQLALVGIDLQVRSLEFQTLRADINAGNFALCQMRWVGIIGPDFGWLFHSTSTPDYLGPKRGSANRGRYANQQVDELIEQAEVEMDPAERWKVAAELQRLLSEDLPYIDLWYAHNFAVMRDDLEGLELTVNASFTPLSKVFYKDR